MSSLHCRPVIRYDIDRQHCQLLPPFKIMCNFYFFIFAILNIKDLTNSFLCHSIKSKIWNILMYTCNVQKSICNLRSNVTKLLKKAAQSRLNCSSRNTAPNPKPPALSKPAGREVPGAIKLGE